MSKEIFERIFHPREIEIVRKREEKTSLGFLRQLLGVESETNLTSEGLPKDFVLPEEWREVITKLSAQTLKTGHEWCVCGFLPYDPKKPELVFSRLYEGTESSMKRSFKEDLKFLKDCLTKFFFKFPVLDIHSHTPTHEEGFSCPLVTSMVDLRIASLNRFIRVFGVIFPSPNQGTDIDLLIKPQNIPFSISDKEIGQEFEEAWATLKEVTDDRLWVLHLGDFKRFAATLVRRYGIAYYSSYNCDSLFSQDLSNGPIILRRVEGEESLDSFLGELRVRYHSRSRNGETQVSS